MKNVRSLKYKGESREELLPGLEPDFPYIASYVELDKYPGRQVPWHWHKEVELFYMKKGVLEYRTPNGRKVFPAGSGGLLNSNVLHATQPHQGVGDTVQMVHIFDASLIGGIPGSLLERKYVAPIIEAPQMELIGLYPQNPEEASILELLRESFYLPPGDFGYEIRLRSVLSDLWCRLLRVSEPFWSRKDRTDKSDEKIKRMMKYIQDHCAEKLSIPEIAATAYVSERECFRIFRRKLNMPPVEYLKSCWVRKACAMLADGNQSLTDIAQSCGLGSSSYFSKVFREYMDCTPKAYRKNMAGF